VLKHIGVTNNHAIKHVITDWSTRILNNNAFSMYSIASNTFVTYELSCVTRNYIKLQ